MRPGGRRDKRFRAEDRPRADRPFAREGRAARDREVGRESRKKREELPALAPDIKPEQLDKGIREELRALPGGLVDLVSRHLVAAGRALEADDPDLAYEHAKAARRFAARIGVVREAAGIAAYRAGRFAEALSDLRAARRLTGSNDYLPIMADCERGLGRPERALDLIRSSQGERLTRAGRVELAIVESGARRDLGQYDAAVLALQRLPELRERRGRSWSARLAFAYADALADAGQTAAAIDWFSRAMAFDEEGLTDAAERYAELTGTVIEDIEDLAEDLPDADAPDGEAADGDAAPAQDRDEDREEPPAPGAAGDAPDGPAAGSAEGDDGRGN